MLCLNKLDEAQIRTDDTEIFHEIYEELPDFVHTREAMQTFYPYGDRKDYPASK